MRLAIAALVVLVLSSAPLFIVGFLDPSSNPVGLGLLFMAGSFVSACLAVLALLALAWRLFRS